MADTRRLAAILAADMVGYSRLMAGDEVATLVRLCAHRSETIDPAIARHNGRLVKTTGDGLLVEFVSAVDAVSCAVEWQRDLGARNDGQAADRRIDFRIGINVGDIIATGDDILGDGVNIAARLEGLAEPGGIAISRSARDAIRDKLAYALDDLGEIEVKNLPRPVRAFRVRLDGVATKPARAIAWKVPALAAALGVAMIAGALALWRPWAEPAAPPAAAPVPASPLALAPLPADAKPVLIVLPFANISDDSQQEYFSDGITEDITTALARIPGFLVMARNTAFTFKGKAVNAQAIGRELGVRYMLEGSVRKAGDRLRLNAQLIETATGNHVWAERYDRPMADVFIVQDELADRIVGTVAAHLRRREGDKAVVASLEKIQAYELTVRARRLFSVGDRDNVLEARRLVMLALERDPTYSLAHAWLVRSLLAVHNNRWNEEFNQPATLAKLVEASSKAVAIDPNEPLNRAANALGILVSGRRDEAVGEAERAIALGQNDADVLSQAAVVLSNAGRHERAIELVSFAHQLDPFIPPQMIGNVLGVAMYQLGRYSEAVDAANYCLKRVPSNTLCLTNLAAAMGQMGSRDTSTVVAELLRASPNLTISEERARRVATNMSMQSIERFAEGLRKAGLPE